MNKAYFRQLNKFATNTEITFDEMKEMVLDWYEPMKIYTRKLDGTRMIREMFTFAGPSGNVKYDYDARGYMILQDIDKGGFRTIVFRNVYRIDKGGKTYIVK
jgi:hypothetical protein